MKNEACREVEMEARRSLTVSLSPVFSLNKRPPSLRVPEGVMAIDVPQNNEISGGGKNGGRKEVGSAISQRKANRGSINMRKDRKEELFSEMLIHT